MLSGCIEMFAGGVERSEAAVVVGKVEVERGVEACDVQAGVVFLDSLLADGVGSIDCSYIPCQGLCGFAVEIGYVVSECAAVERVSADPDCIPKVQELGAGVVDVSAASLLDGLGDGGHCWVGVGRFCYRWCSFVVSSSACRGMVGMASVVRSPWSAERIVAGCSDPRRSISTSAPIAVLIAG